MVYIDTARDPSHDPLRPAFLDRLIGFISAGSVFILVLLPDLVPSASKLLLISR